MKGSDQARHLLADLDKLKNELTEDAIKIIKALGFGVFVDILLYKMNRSFALWAVSLCRPTKCKTAMCKNEDAIVFVLDETCRRVMTSSALEVLIGLPRGKQVVPAEYLQNTTLAELQNAIQVATGIDNNWRLVDVTNNCKQAKLQNDHMLQARLFIAAVLQFGIISTFSNYLTNPILREVADIIGRLTARCALV